MDPIRNAWSQRTMRLSSIVMVGPLTKVSAQVRYVQRDDIPGIHDVVQQKLVILIAREGFPQLPQGPLRRRMFGDIEVKQTSGSDLEGNEYIKDTETHRHGNEEVAIPYAWFRRKVDQC